MRAPFRGLDPNTLAERISATSRINRVALVAGVLWTVLVLSYAGGYFGGPGGGQARGTVFLDVVFFLMALLLPLGLVGLAAWLAAELARQRQATAALAAATEPLVAALAETRAALAKEGPLTQQAVETAVRDAISETRVTVTRDVTDSVDQALNEIRGGQRRLEAAIADAAAAAVPAPREPVRGPAAGLRDRVDPGDVAARVRAAARAARAARAMAAPETSADEPTLPIEAPQEEALGWDDLLKALDFPRDADDTAGFAALRRALRHHLLAQMLQAAEDVLNLLSQETVFMEDLRHEPAPAAAWRAFAEGARDVQVASVGGIRDERALDVVRAMMRADPVFRDTSLFFQRRFDAVLREIAPRADDAALIELADTRTGRAFMLCARASGSFG